MNDMDLELEGGLMQDAPSTLIGVGRYINPNPEPNNPGGYFALYSSSTSGPGVTGLTPLPEKDLNRFKVTLRQKATESVAFKSPAEVKEFVRQMQNKVERVGARYVRDRFKFRYVGAFNPARPADFFGWMRGLFGQL